jgi:hypothetical protein
MLKSQTYLPNKKPLAGLFYFAVGFRGARGFVGACSATGFFLAGALGLAAGTGATPSDPTTMGSTTGAVGAGVSTLYGTASALTAGASVPGRGFPVNQLKIAFSIVNLL